jgi:hypothetical protein
MKGDAGRQVFMPNHLALIKKLRDRYLAFAFAGGLLKERGTMNCCTAIRTTNGASQQVMPKERKMEKIKLCGSNALAGSSNAKSGFREGNK